MTRPMMEIPSAPDTQGARPPGTPAPMTDRASSRMCVRPLSVLRRRWTSNNWRPPRSGGSTFHPKTAFKLIFRDQVYFHT